jgi:hypothetical protein
VLELSGTRAARDSIVIMDESELNRKAAGGVRFVEDGDAYAESGGRRMARIGDSLVLSVPGFPPYALTLFAEVDQDPDVRVVWGEGPNAFVRVARHWIDGTPPQRVFSTMHVDVVARRVLQSADTTHPSDAVATLFETADEVVGHVSTLDAFVTVEKPDSEVSWEMDWGSLAWTVMIGSDGVRFTPTSDLHPNTGPALPFPRSKRDRGRQHVLEVPDGFLVGSDEGEWGGRLDFVARDGKRVATLAEANTHGIVCVADNILSLHGINHLSLREGSVRFWIWTDNQFSSAGEHELDGGPECFTVSGDLLWVLTACGLWKIAGRNVERVHAVEVVPFGATSLVVDSAGDIWAGMRHFVLHFKRRGDGFEEEWLVKKDAQSPRPWPS